MNLFRTIKPRPLDSRHVYSRRWGMRIGLQKCRQLHYVRKRTLIIARQTVPLCDLLESGDLTANDWFAKRNGLSKWKAVALIATGQHESPAFLAQG